MNLLNGGDKATINQLNFALKEKDEIISLYEERLKSLIRSKKGLTKQKNALEEAVKVLQSREERTGEVAALSNSLTALMGEKNRCETELKESRKKVLLDLEEAKKQIEALTRDLNLKDKEASSQLEELKSKLIVEQHERQQELQNHTSTLKELQKRLFEERSEKAKLKNEKETALNKCQDEPTPSNTNAHKEIVKTEQSQLSLSSNGNYKTVSADELNRLRKEMNEMELHHREQLEKAELRAAEAEKRSIENQEIQESRVMNLELRLEELSDTVAAYDRQRHEDQISIAKLRERIAQLDTENCALTHVRQPPEDSFDLDEEEGLESIAEKIIRLRSKLKERNLKSDNPISDIDAYFSEENKDDNNPIHEEWKSKYFKLSEEFEAYKEQNASPNNDAHNFKRLMSEIEVDQEEINSLKNQVSELKEKINRLRSQLSLNDEAKVANENKIRSLNTEINNYKLSMNDTLQSKEVEMRNKTLTLESELIKQRERFLSSMKEKDEELKNMRDNLEIAIDNGFVSYMNRKSSGNLGATNIDTLTDKLNLSMDDESKMMLHYSEESARKDKEMSDLRNHIRDLESGMRDIQARFINKEEDYVMEVEALNEKIAVLQRMSKSDFNVEYLKNVVVNYMLSSDISSKEHMLNAIAAVLVFSEKEIRKIKAFHNSWFWKKS